MKKIKILFFLLMFAPFAIYANIINVPGDYSTIQAAINASTNGDTVLVAPNTYFENINFRGRNIVLTSRFYITNDPADIWATVINGSTPSQTDSASCVIFNNNEDSTAVLQGFTITGGGGTKWQDEHGPGRYREGGGILVAFSSPVIQFNIIHNNQCIDLTGVTSTGGGGIRAGDSFQRIYNNIIMNNTGRYGAGIVLNYAGGDIRNNIICVNYGSNSYGAGAGIWINGSYSRPKIIMNNTIADNSALQGTCGVYASGSSTLRNNIVWGNTSPSHVQLSGSLIVNYCDVQGGYTGGGNIDALPQFADSNYYLSTGSPCIDKGDSSTIYNDPEDPNNTGYALYPALGTIRNDIGAYGGPLARILSNLLIGIKQSGTNIPGSFMLHQNYPNPFNPATKIRFNLPENSNGIVQLIIYDILGREISVLVNSILSPGTYEVVWNASGFSSGVYFYTLRTGDYSETKKMVLTK
jgi:hypothetical protein